MIVKVNGQLTETFFSDTEIKEGGRIFDHIKDDPYIIICGKSFDNYPGQPSVTKIDTLGNIIWTTTTNDTASYIYPNVFVYKIFKSGGFIYALVLKHTWPGEPKEIWKIDDSDGSVLWKSQFYTNYFLRPQHLIDYDSSKFLIGYYESSGNPKFAFMSKANGDTLSTYSMGISSNNSNLKFGLAVDSDLDIYYSYKDSIFKADGTSPNSIYWRNAPPASSNIVDFTDIYIDANDSIYLFSRYDAYSATGGRPKTIAINSSNGNLLWQTITPGDDIQSVAFIDKNGYLYSTWRHAMVGGGYFDFWTSKINKLTGNRAWYSVHSFGNGGEAAMSIDVDNNGDVFLTGYFGDANYGPEDWGIVKLNGNTGYDIYEKNISIDNLKNDDLSVGMAVCVFNNKPYFVGELETSNNNGVRKSKVTFVEIDNSTGSLLQRKFIGGSYQFPSKTIQIEKFGANKTIVFKQVGRFTNVEMYDSNKTLLWEKSFIKNFMLFGGDLIINKYGTIVFSASSISEKSSKPFFSNQTDSMYVFYLDTLGNLTNYNSFYVGFNDAYPLEIQDDGVNTFVFYNKFNFIYYRKIDASGVSMEYSLNVMYNDLMIHPKYTVNNTNSTMLIFGFKNSANRIIKLNKNTTNTTDVAVIPSIDVINYVVKNSASRVFLCGRNNGGNDVLISYNTALLNTIWTKTYSSQAEMFKFTFNDDSTFIYSIGTQSSDVIIRKIAVSTGLEKWSYSFNGSSNLTCKPTDIAFDKYKNEIVITGYQLDNSSGNKNVFIEIIDTSGANVNTYIKQGAFEGDNMGICTQVINDGSVWIGGSLNDSVYGKAGVIFDTDSSTSTSIEDLFYSHIYPSSTIEAYPNPFRDFLNVKFTISENNSNVALHLYNAEGKTIYSYFHKYELKGDYTIRINTTKLSGIHILSLWINEQVLTKKVMGVNR